jgi:molybdate transport system substrate-binding protein
MKIKMGLLAGLLFATVYSAQATDLVVFSAAAMKGAFEQAPEQYFKATGDHVRFVYGTAGQVHDRAVAGEAFDLVVVPPAPLADLVKRHLAADGSVVKLAVVRLGAAVRSGAPSPQIGDEQAFRQTLLDAPSIGMADPATGATSGVYLAGLIDRLGIRDRIGARIKYYTEGQAAMEAMARGEVSLGLGQISEITPVRGVTLVGAIPDNLQLKTTYAAGIAANTKEPEAVKRLLDYLSGPIMRKSLAANGFEAGS